MWDDMTSDWTIIFLLKDLQLNLHRSLESDDERDEQICFSLFFHSTSWSLTFLSKVLCVQVKCVNDEPVSPVLY